MEELARNQLIWVGKPCPKCNRKGLHLARHPHAFGLKDTGKVSCRFCRATFNKDKLIAHFVAQEKKADDE